MFLKLSMATAHDTDIFINILKIISFWSVCKSIFPVSSKPFLKPGKMSAGDEQPLKQQALGAVVSAKHDPSAPNALVLPRPSQGHQVW